MKSCSVTSQRISGPKKSFMNFVKMHSTRFSGPENIIYVEQKLFVKSGTMKRLCITRPEKALSGMIKRFVFQENFLY